MSVPTPEESRAADAAGIFGHFTALLSANAAYFRARLQLAGLEGKDAALRVAVAVGLGVAALIGTVFGYFFLVIALVFFIARAFESENAWIWVMLGAGLVHFAGAGLLAWLAKGRLMQPMFSATLDEFKKDQEWLKTPTNPN